MLYSIIQRLFDTVTKYIQVQTSFKSLDQIFSSQVSFHQFTQEILETGSRSRLETVIQLPLRAAVLIIGTVQA